MPTFSTIALENLLEPQVRNSLKSAEITKKLSVSDGNNGWEEQREKALAPKHIFISPALYTTPEPSPVPSEPPGSPSPYVANHKGRGRGGRRIGGFEIPPVPKEVKEEEKVLDLDLNLNSGEEEVVEKFCGVEEQIDDIKGVEDEKENGKKDENETEIEVEDENEFFLDPTTNSSSRFESHSFVSAQADFFDANEEFTSEGSVSSGTSYGARIESDLRSMRLSLLEEIERRKTAEDNLKAMQSQWQRISNLLSQAGFSFPEPSDATGKEQHDVTSIEKFCQEIEVAKFVANAIGKGEARAEAEAAAQAILESKEHEISRLRDKVHYYEAVNHEMSQRNQEIVDVARKQRLKKNRQRKWLWSGFAVSAVMGTAVLALSYLTSNDQQSLPSASDTTNDGSFIDCSDTA